MTTNPPPSVAIAGAGLAGLTLAHSLVRDGIDVQVYESDPAPFVRRQGYRITVDGDGREALRRCLPRGLFDLAMATAGEPGGFFRFTNSALRGIATMSFAAGQDSARQVDRQTLRAILLLGLEDRVHFGKAAVGVAEVPDGAVLTFRDGTSAKASVVVGADGVGSALRRQVLPGCEPVSTGLHGIYGRASLAGGDRGLVPEALGRSGVLAIGDRPGSAFFFTTMRFHEPPATAFARLAPGHLPPVEDDYVMWALVLPAAEAGTAAGSKTSEAEAEAEAAAAGTAGAGLQRHALARARGFHPALRRMIEASDPAFTMTTAFSAAPRPRGWRLPRVTLMGDAVHVMPPFGAHGGNTALRDAALLAARIGDAVRNGRPLESALAAYEEDMVPYAFKAVDAAAGQLRRMTAGGALLRWVLLRAVPRLHRVTVPLPGQAP